jgi:hypothetical protein
MKAQAQNDPAGFATIEVPLKHYSLSQLATYYGVCDKTLKKQLKPYQDEIGEKQGRFYTLRQVKVIFSKLGTPSIVGEESLSPKEPKEHRTVVLPETIELLTNSTWGFARTILWEKQRFTESELSMSKGLISEYYRLIAPDQFTQMAKELFIQYCERILLARLYKDKSYYRFIPHPCIWLDRNYLKGFAGTKTWYERLKHERKNNPEYYSDVRLVAELYAEYALNPSAEVFSKASKAFSEKGAKMLKLFCASIKTINENKLTA